MTLTNNLSLTLVETAQAQKEVTVNQALARIDGVMNMCVLDRDLAAPPGSPAAGDAYIVGPSATGAWAGKDGQVAWFDQVWRFLVPKKGFRVLVADEWMFYLHDGTGWRYEEGFYGNLAQQASSGSAYTVNYAAGTTHEVTLTAASVALSFSNAPFAFKTGRILLILKQDGTGGRVVTWPGAVKWPGGAAPTLTAAANAVDMIELVTVDNGTTWFGRVWGADVK